MVQRIYDLEKGPIQKLTHSALRFLMRLLTHKRINIWVALLIFVVSVLYCASECSWDYISRCGSLITVMGVLMMERRNLRLGPDMAYHMNRAALDNEKPPLTQEQEKQEVINIHADISSAYWGFTLILLGTITWGYGDVIAQNILPL